MANDNGDKPITVKDFQEVIIPAMESVFATKKDLESFATKKDLEMMRFSLQTDMKENFVNKVEFQELKDLVLTNFDKILKDLDILMTEQKMGYYQKQKERKLWTIMIEAMQKHQILSTDQVKEIQGLEIF